jgi:hypothetical protein
VVGIGDAAGAPDRVVGTVIGVSVRVAPRQGRMADELISVRTRSRGATGLGVPMRVALAVRRVVVRFVERRQSRAVCVAGAVRGHVRQWCQLGGNQEHAEQDGPSRPSHFPECWLVAAHCLYDDSISHGARPLKDSR